MGRIQDSDIPGELWKHPGLRGITSNRVVSVGDIAQASLAESAGFADTSAQAVQQITKISPTEKYLVLFPATNTEFKKWTISTTNDAAGAFVLPQSEGTQGWVTIDVGLSVAPGSTILDNPAYLEHIIRHEMFHANTLAGGPASEGNAPLWVIEGFAEWAASTATVVFPAKTPPAVLPVKDSEFAHDTTTYAYARSFIFVSYLVSRFGQPAAMHFYNRCREPANGSIESSFQHVFGRALREVDHEWAAQYKKQVASLKVDVWER